MRHLSFLLLVILPFLGACSVTEPFTTVEAHVLNNAQYWQRAEANSALYLRGPKAQQTLNQHLAHCVVSVRELERTAAIKRGVPGLPPRDPAYPDDGMRPGSRMIDNETPDRDGFLRSEYLEYHDFETCMASKGWERVEYLPYRTAERARGEYIDMVNMNLFGSKNRYHDDYSRDTQSNEEFGLNSD